MPEWLKGIVEQEELIPSNKKKLGASLDTGKWGENYQDNTPPHPPISYTEQWEKEKI